MKTIRIVCVQVDSGTAAHVGGPVEVEHKTFDVEAPELVDWIHEYLGKNGGKFLSRSVVGVEVLGNVKPKGSQ